jgi:ribosomal 50S subunit-recycling heat shock protein
MRLDLFLKWSRVIPRRTLAKEMCDAGRVTVNRGTSRAGREVQIGDTIEIDFPRRWMKARVRAIPPHAPAKDSAKEMVEILEDRKISTEPESE